MKLPKYDQGKSFLSIGKGIVSKCYLLTSCATFSLLLRDSAVFEAVMIREVHNNSVDIFFIYTHLVVGLLHY